MTKPRVTPYTRPCGRCRHRRQEVPIHEAASHRLRQDKIRTLSAGARQRYAQVTVYGTDAYPDLDQKAAVLLESLVRNRALMDGNKRIGWLATVVFYGLNTIELEAPDDDAYDLVIIIASSATTYQDAASHLAKWH